VGAFTRYPWYGHLAGQIGRYNQVQNGRYEALAANIYSNHWKAMGNFLEDYYGLTMSFTNNKDNMVFKQADTVFQCPNGFFSQAPPGMSATPTNHSIVDYFFAGFAAHQYRELVNSWPYVGYPFAVPRMDRITELNGDSIAFVMDYTNHPYRVNCTGADGATRRYNFNECYPLYGEYGSFTYVPRGFAVAYMGNHFSDNYFNAVQWFTYYDGNGTYVNNTGLTRMSYFGY
jgi:hypothetical protein